MRILSVLAAPVLALALIPGATLANPFPAAGDWRGEGRIIRDDGASARLRCQMSGDLPTDQSWQATLTCASVDGRFTGGFDLSINGAGQITGTGALRSETTETFGVSGQTVGEYLIFDVGQEVRVQLLVGEAEVEMSFAQIGADSEAPGGGIVRFSR